MTFQLETVFTIGVYGYAESAFFDALVDSNIDLFIDIRMRRGLRGSRYRFANSAALQRKLRENGIAYAHLKQLAPTAEIRAFQHQADNDEKTAKRDRTELNKAYIHAFKRDILKVYKRKPENKLDCQALLHESMTLANYPADRPLRRIALFCVEAHPHACHRSLVAAEFGRRLGVAVQHIHM